MSVERVGDARLPTDYGEFRIVSYRAVDGHEHVAMVAGGIAAAMNLAPWILQKVVWKLTFPRCGTLRNPIGVVSTIFCVVTLKWFRP